MGMDAGAVRWISRAVLPAIAALVCLALPAVVRAATITPNTLADDYDAVTPDGSCSLREAVQSAEESTNFGGCVAGGAYTGADTIELNPGSYVLTILPTGSNNLSSGDLNVGATDLAIAGPASGMATIDGFGADRVFNCFSGTGSLALRGVTVTDAAATDSSPGASVNGGGILAGACPLSITDSTIAGNIADGFGAGISSNGPVTLTNVTVSGNITAELAGAGIALFGDGALVLLDHVTVTNNQTQTTSGDLVAGGIFVNGLDPPAVTAHNSIIAGNADASTTTDAPDCQGPITSSGGNVIGDTSGCTFSSVSSDVLNVDAMLGVLMDNGGTTMTHALLDGSPAIDHAVGASPFTDQRGFARPFPVGGACDTGAYEFGAVLSAGTPGCQPPPPPPMSPPPSTAVPTTTSNPRCAALRKKLKKAKRAHNPAKVRKLRRKLRRLGC